MVSLPEAKYLRLTAGPCHAGSWSVLPVRRCLTRRSARLPPPFERLDDDHASAAAWAWRTEVVWFFRGVIGRRSDVQQFTGEREAGLARRTGKQAVVADAMEAAWQDVEQEPTNELVGGERHDLLPVGARAAIVLVAEGDAALVEARSGGCSRWRPGGCSATDRRAPLPVRRTAAWHRPPSACCERASDDAGRPVARPGAPPIRRRQSRPASCSAIKPGEEQAAEQLAEHPHRKEEGRARRYPAFPSSEMPPPGTIMCTCGWWVIAEPHV